MHAYGTCKRDRGASCWCCRPDRSVSSLRRYRKRARRKAKQEIGTETETVSKLHGSKRPTAESS